jgi:hypothetical protein
MTPGVYTMSAEAYHADPCPAPSLSAGMINHILRAPAVCQFNSPRLNPDYEQPEDNDRFAIGSVAHLLFLEPDQLDGAVTVVDATDWRTSKAKAERQEARDAGRTAILAKHWQTIQDMRAAFTLDPFISRAFTNGKPEVSMFWRHPTAGIWCRARPDWTPDSGAYLCDFKTTANANPADFPRHAYNMGYHRRAAWYLDGYAAITGRAPDHYWFVNQETTAPYLTSVVELDMQAIEAGRMENDRAALIFARCLDSGSWPGYSDASARRVGLPTYAYMQIDGRLAMPEQY